MFTLSSSKKCGLIHYELQRKKYGVIEGSKQTLERFAEHLAKMRDA